MSFEKCNNCGTYHDPEEITEDGLCVTCDDLVPKRDLMFDEFDPNVIQVNMTGGFIYQCTMCGHYEQIPKSVGICDGCRAEEIGNPFPSDLDVDECDPDCRCWYCYESPHEYDED